jgi:hypothetical protein
MIGSNFMFLRDIIGAATPFHIFDLNNMAFVTHSITRVMNFPGITIIRAGL